MARKLRIVEPGTKFNMLTYLHDVAPINGVRAAMFRCDCGEHKAIKSNPVFVGVTKSCGCYMERFRIQEPVRKRIREMFADGVPINMIHRELKVNDATIRGILGLIGKTKQKTPEGCFNWADYKDGVL